MDKDNNQLNRNFIASGPCAEDVLKFQVKRLITNLFKLHLNALETLAEENDIALDKLIQALPDEFKGYVELANHHTPEHQDILRRKTLSDGNNSFREFELLLSNFRIEYKQK